MDRKLNQLLINDDFLLFFKLCDSKLNFGFWTVGQTKQEELVSES